MADLQCKLCGKQFTAPSKLTQHRTRRTPCMIVVPSDDYLSEEDRAKPFKCLDCGRRYVSPSTLSTHSRRNCPARKAAALAVQPPAPAPVTALVVARDEHATTLTSNEIMELKTLRERLSQLELQVGATLLQAPSVQHNVVYNNVTVNVFGEETWKHIDSTRIQGLLDCLMPEELSTKATRTQAEKAMSTMFERTAMLIYSDVTHPENLTAYIPRPIAAPGAADADQVMVYRGGPVPGQPRWEMATLQEVAPPMAKKTLDLLQVRQPLASGQRDLTEYGLFIKSLFEKEKQWVGGRELRAVLVKNATLIQQRHPGGADSVP